MSLQTVVTIFLIIILTFTFDVKSTVSDTYVIGSLDKDEGPPIQPLILKLLSSVLTSEECMSVYGFLIVRHSVSKLHKLINLNATFEYVDYLQKTHQNLIVNNQRRIDFDCWSSLKYWNVQLVGFNTKEMIDRKNFAESLLRVALNSIQRFDLSEWVFNQTRIKRHKELQELEKEIESHLISRIEITPTPDEDRGFIMFLLVFGILSVLMCITLCVIVIIWSNRNATFPPTTTNNSFNQSKRNSFKIKNVSAKETKKLGKGANNAINKEDTNALLLNIEV